MALLDILQAIAANLPATMPAPGLSAVTPSSGATGVVSVSGTPQATFSPVLQVTTSGPVGTAQAKLSVDGGLTFGLPGVLGATTVMPDGITISSSGTFTAGDSYSWSAVATPSVLYGEEAIGSNYGSPTVIFVPVGDAFQGTQDYSWNGTPPTLPGAITTVQARTEVHVRGVDYRATELLRDQVLNAIRGTVGAFQIEGAHWGIKDPSVSRYGRGYVFTFSVLRPVLDLFATQTTQVVPPTFTEILTEEVDNIYGGTTITSP